MTPKRKYAQPAIEEYITKWALVDSSLSCYGTTTVFKEFSILNMSPTELSWYLATGGN